MAYSYSDRLDHAGVLFNHLDRLGKEVNELFKKEMKDGNLAGALPSSKMRNWMASVQWLETMLVPYLGKAYNDRKKLLLARYRKAWKAQDLDACFETINEQSQILVLEAYNQGFMLKQTISGDYVIDQDKDKGDSSKPKEP